MSSFINEHFVALAIASGVCIIIGLSMLGAEEMVSEGAYDNTRGRNATNFAFALCGWIISAVLAQYAEQRTAMYLAYGCAIIGGLVALRSGYNTVRRDEYVSY